MSELHNLSKFRSISSQVVASNNAYIHRAISGRRNALLREMYHMMRRRQNVGSVLTLEDEDEADLHVFLQRFDLTKKYVFNLNSWRSNCRMVPCLVLTPAP